MTAVLYCSVGSQEAVILVIALHSKCCICVPCAARACRCYSAHRHLGRCLWTALLCMCKAESLCFTTLSNGWTTMLPGDSHNWQHEETSTLLSSRPRGLTCVHLHHRGWQNHACPTDSGCSFATHAYHVAHIHNSWGHSLQHAWQLTMGYPFQVGTQAHRVGLDDLCRQMLWIILGAQSRVWGANGSLKRTIDAPHF